VARSTAESAEPPFPPLASGVTLSPSSQIGVRVEEHRLVLIVIEVSDVHRAAKLYRDGFGIDLHVDDHEGASHGPDDRWTSGVHAAYSWKEGAFLHFALYPAKEDGPTANVQLGFDAPDLDIVHRQATAEGAELIHHARPEPWGMTSRYRDFDGNVISFTAST
jgi:predicted enzyme related to lactoylglutathione lyase